MIKALGGKVCDWLPVIERGEMRSTAEVADRALTLHAMIEVAFGVPTEVIAAWIRGNNLEASLSRQERAILARKARPTQRRGAEQPWLVHGGIVGAGLGWWADRGAARRETHWATTWLHCCPTSRGTRMPAASVAGFALRPAEEIHAMLDLYYRAHWYARDGRLNGYPTGAFDLDRIMERRRALEWISDRTLADWADTPEDT